MKTFVLILSLCVFQNCMNENTIKKTTLYHRAFFLDDPYGGYYDDELLDLPECNTYTIISDNFNEELQRFLIKLEKDTIFMAHKGAKSPSLLLVIEFGDGTIKKIYSWNNGSILFEQKLFKKNLEFMTLIEKYFDKVSWSDPDKDFEHNS